jgi:antitoxin HicB
VICRCDEGGYVAKVPALKSFLAQGETIHNTLEELAIIAKPWIETAQKHGRPLTDVEIAIASGK